MQLPACRAALISPVMLALSCMSQLAAVTFCTVSQHCMTCLVNKQKRQVAQRLDEMASNVPVVMRHGHEQSCHILVCHVNILHIAPGRPPLNRNAQVACHIKFGPAGAPEVAGCLPAL